MRHRNAGRKLSRNGAHRKALLRNLAMNLLQHGRIQTTDAKAKELRPVVERLITLGKRVSPESIANAGERDAASLRARRVHAVRLAREWVRDRDVLMKLFGEYSTHFQGRPGGYTRITKLGNRHGDNAPMSIIELVLDGAVAIDAPAPTEAAAAAE